MNGHYEGNIAEYLDALGIYLEYTYNITLDKYDEEDTETVCIELAQFGGEEGCELIKSQYIYLEDTQDFEDKVIEQVKLFMEKSSEQIDKEEDEREAREVAEHVAKARAAGNDYLANLLLEINKDMNETNTKENENNQSEG